MAGAGPRATPTFHEGKIYATCYRKLNCLDAAEGTALWTREMWVSMPMPSLRSGGFASSSP